MGVAMGMAVSDGQGWRGRAIEWRKSHHSEEEDGWAVRRRMGM
jgi:hypothetical protein